MNNLNIDIYAKGIDLTPELREYVMNRVTNLGKYLSETNEDIRIHFEVGKTSNHHKESPEGYEASCRFVLHGKEYYAKVFGLTTYEAIDNVKEHLYREIRDAKGRRESVFRRGHRMIRKIFNRE